MSEYVVGVDTYSKGSADYCIVTVFRKSNKDIVFHSSMIQVAQHYSEKRVDFEEEVNRIAKYFNAIPLKEIEK